MYIFVFSDLMAKKGTTPQFCLWDEMNTLPKCMSHRNEEGLVYLAHQAGVRVYLSIGGWNLSDSFPVMTASASARANFTEQCIKLIGSYNFDAIDLGKLLLLCIEKCCTEISLSRVVYSI